MKHVTRIITFVLDRHFTRSFEKQCRLSYSSAKNFRSEDQYDSNRNTRSLYLATFGAASLLTSLLAYKKVLALHDEKNNVKKVYRRDEVASHDTLDKGVWITYKGNVYDITEFIQHHPGGSHTILMGAGGDVGPFWQTYSFHEEAEVQKLLAKYYIGELSTSDQSSELGRPDTIYEGPYANDPIRSPLLQVWTKEPFNAETPSKLLTPTFLTPTDALFVRNHLPVPEIDLKDYKLEICIGSDGDQDNLKVIAELNLDELKTKFKPVTINSVIQCSGNRRSDLKKIKEIKGLAWNVGAIGNVEWTGVRLVDVLASLNLKDISFLKHIQLEGLDCDLTGQAYAASISADVALDPGRDVILAYEMNGQPLTRDHGFPLRFVAPGITGARNVKWLGKVILSHEESNGHWQRNDYKSFSPNTDMFNLDYKQSISIQEMPVQSAICDPKDGDELDLKLDKQVTVPVIPVRGYAYSGGGRMIIRVDVSIDNGLSWITANLDDLPKQDDGLPNFERRNQTWSWMRWSINIPIADEIIKNGSGTLEILCRAFDSSYNSQPERATTIWNVRGVVNNSWHKIKLRVKTK